MVARNADDMILGINIMSKHGFKLDVKERTLRVGNIELVLIRHNEPAVHIITEQDEVLPPRCDTLVMSRLERTQRIEWYHGANE